MSGRSSAAARTALRVGPSARWRVARLRTALLYRPAFAAIGPGSVIVRPIALRGVDQISIGRDCALASGVWLACEDGGGPIEIGDRVSFAPGVHVHSYDPISIGDDCTFAEGVYVGSADHDPADHDHIRGTGAVSIGAGVFVGLRAVVLGGVTIGAGAVVGAHAVVTSDVAPGAVVMGVPARERPRG